MLTISIFLLSSCGNENGTAKIKVVLNGTKNKTFLIEEIVPKGIVLLDSIKTNSKGKFTYRYKFKDKNPVFLRIFRDESDHLTLLVSPGETLNVNSIINLATNYTVEGSEGSEYVRDLNLMAIDTYSKIDNLSSIYNSTTIESQKINIENQWAQLYVDQKRKYIDFLVHHPKSLACIVALFQSFTNGMVVFGDKNDFAYFNMIADSLSTVYPTSPHVKSLVKDVQTRTNSINRLQNIIKIEETLPNINLPDIYIKYHDLNSIKEKSILLVFWSTVTPNSAMTNQELKRLYNNMKGKDFEIYQVSLDRDNNQWISAMVDQDLPWINVRDEGGSFATSAHLYQIKALPSNYLISKDGVIEGKNLWGADLVKKVEELTK